MKKIILIVGGIIIVAILGCGIWAYQQATNDEARTDIVSPLVTTTAPVQANITTPTLTVTPVPNQKFLFPAGGEYFNLNITTPEVYKISWTPFLLKEHESLEFWLSRVGKDVSIRLFDYGNEPVRNLNLESGTADWAVTYDRVLDYGDSTYQYQLTIRKVKQLNCFKGEKCEDPTGPSYEIVSEIISKPFHMYGPLS